MLEPWKCLGPQERVEQEMEQISESELISPNKNDPLKWRIKRFVSKSIWGTVAFHLKGAHGTPIEKQCHRVDILMVTSKNNDLCHENA